MKERFTSQPENLPDTQVRSFRQNLSNLVLWQCSVSITARVAVLAVSIAAIRRVDFERIDPTILVSLDLVRGKPI